jgi:hypothetical protein
MALELIPSQKFEGWYSLWQNIKTQHSYQIYKKHVNQFETY